MKIQLMGEKTVGLNNASLTLLIKCTGFKTPSNKTLLIVELKNIK